MTVAIHQPNYLPWLGYFYKIFACDVFVFHDAVGFSTSSYTKRCRIRIDSTSAKTTWLSVPVQHHHAGTSISDIRIAHRNDWIGRHLNKIENTYRTALYFDEIFPWLQSLLNEGRTLSRLAELNKNCITHILERLSIRTELRSASELRVDGKGKALILQIIKSCDGDTYLAGTGSRNYMDTQALQDAGIRNVVHDFGKWTNTNPYDQGTGKFTAGLSIVDALMHIGTGGILKLFQQFHSQYSDIGQ